MEQNKWNNDPIFQNMGANKMDFMMGMLSEIQGKNKNELMPFLLSVTSRANSKGIQFSDEETDFILKALSKNMSPAEKNKINMIRQMSQMIGSRSKK